MEYGNWDGWREMKDTLYSGDLEVMIAEIHGDMRVSVVTISLGYGSDEDPKNDWVSLWVADSTDFSELPADGTKVKITGVIWKKGTNIYLVTDKAHIVTE